MLKRFLCIALALGLIISLCACGEPKDTANSNTGSRPNSSSSRLVSALPPKLSGYMSEDLKGSTVRFATWVDHTVTEGAVPLANFENDTGLKAELCIVQKNGYVNTLLNKIASGDVPDVFVSDTGENAFPLTFQIAAPINKVSSVNLKEPIWDKSLLEFGTIDGDIYFVNTIGSPWNSYNIVFYNKPLFEENGLKTPKEYYEEGKWTWDRLEQTAQDIKNLGDDYKGIALTDPTVLTDSLGTSFVKYDYKTNLFSNGTSDEKLKKGYECYAAMREKDLLDGSISAFTQNKCGIVITDSYGLRNHGYFKDMYYEDVGFTYLPSLEEGGESYISSDFRMYGICHRAPNADAAGYFIRYWLDPRNYELNHTLLTIEAGNFYYQLTNTVATRKHFNFDAGVITLIDGTTDDIWKPASEADRDNVKNALDSVFDKVEQAVNNANKQMINKITSDQEYYK